MRFILPFLASLSLLAQQPQAAPAPAVPKPAPGLHRYMVVRTWPAGALDNVDAEAKSTVNKNNARFKVRWVHSYAVPDLTKTFCIYEGPDPKAIRDAAKANNMPVDSITEIPKVLESR